MTTLTKKNRVLENCDPNNIPLEVLLSPEPILLKGLVKGWELVKTGLTSNKEAIDYLKSFYNGKPAGSYFGSPDINGRFAYNEDISQVNFEVKKTQLNDVLDLISKNLSNPNPPSYYVASNSIDGHFPELRNTNDLNFQSINMEPINPIASIWIGNKSLVPCHYDGSNNIACCVAGKRRFTLFPPEDIHNLYPGPLHPTPGGQAISMVDFESPDYDKYPRFKEAEKSKQVFDLEPGDALYFPSMWWHQVEGLSAFNILINYWWSLSPVYRGQPMNVLNHALLSIRDLPVEEKKAWKHIFDYYIFGDAENAGEHLPEHAKGLLGEINDLKARQLKAMLLNKLNR
jgi:hypothetical protein